MDANFIGDVAEHEDDNGRNLHVSEIRSNLLKQMMYDGMQIVSGAALATYSWKLGFHSISTFVFSTIGAAGVIGFCMNIRKYSQIASNIQKGGIGPKWYLTTGTVTYFSNVYALSEALMRSHELWIPCVGVGGFGYCLAVSSMNSLGRTILNRMPLLKCVQLMFGPALIAGGAYYLLGFRQHDDMFCLPWIAFVAVGNHIAFTGYKRFGSNDQPNWLLFKGIELLLGGCIMCINGAVLVVYSMNNGYHAIITVFYFTMILNGISDISSSLEAFQEYADLEPQVFNCICGMTAGPVIFLSTCLGVKFIQNPIVVPSFFLAAGISLVLLIKSVMDLHDLLPRRMFFRYSRRVLGPVITVWGTVVTIYTGYHLGWRSSLVAISLIPMGVLATYRGFTNMDELE
ncbi:uncharacterized protein LOC129976283 [Argiope bruennichi]|uniref:uncharacterized protein LOC129976283 n=1 Tax=Argiope bruennichi TaxID=94029 RepID=UPI0024953A38|nr:uncharacterized protein LOC129976283 [Argiope bruennichi]